jgi:hypothetical protein
METKQEFIENLQTVTSQILFEREESKIKRLNALKGEHAEESFKILKNGVKYLCFLILVLVLILTNTSIVDFHDINK